MSELKLKPCPFCGGKAIPVVDDETEDFFGVKCFACGGSIQAEKESLDEAIEAWNRRTKSVLKKHITSKPIKTNSDKLRQMSDNELAKWLNDNDCYFPIGDRTQYWIDLLKQEEESEC